MLLLFFCFQLLINSITSQCNGCASSTLSSCLEYIPTLIYGCKGAITSGISSGSSLCAPNYYICNSLTTLTNLGLTKEICAKNESYGNFYATLITGSSLNTCDTVATTGDIYGCSTGDELSTEPWNTEKKDELNYTNCSPLTSVIADFSAVNGQYGWSGLQNNNELNSAVHSGIEGGGVMCCLNTSNTGMPTMLPTMIPTIIPTMVTGQPTVTTKSVTVTLLDQTIPNGDIGVVIIILMVIICILIIIWLICGFIKYEHTKHYEDDNEGSWKEEYGDNNNNNVDNNVNNSNYNDDNGNAGGGGGGGDTVEEVPPKQPMAPVVTLTFDSDAKEDDNIIVNKKPYKTENENETNL